MNDPFTPAQRKAIDTGRKLCQSCRERLSVARRIGLPNETLEQQVENAGAVIDAADRLIEEYRQAQAKGQ